MGSKKILSLSIAAVLLLLVTVNWMLSYDEENSSSETVVIQGDTPVEITVVDPTPPSKQEEVREEPILVQTPVNLPTADRVDELFSLYDPKLPIVETITYKSRVPWQKGRPAWVSDYAGHYKTSRHFIARSLNGAPNYNKQDVKDGDRFNVLRCDKNFSFHLVLDTSCHTLWLYYIDHDKNEKELIKNYSVSIGRKETSRPSGLLTPHGTYTLGDKIMIYEPKMMGYHKEEKTEMIRVFGTRWIPFASEVEGCTAPAKGYGIHGVPWIEDPLTGVLKEDPSSIGKYESDGCIRLATKDVEELFSIIVSRPTTIEIVDQFHKATYGGAK